MDIVKKVLVTEEGGYYQSRRNETALKVQQELNLDLKLVLFHAIKDDEEFAMTLIDGSKDLKIPLSEANEDNQTPLLWACFMEKPKIVEAILKELVNQDIDISIKEQDGYGRTPFLLACKNGWTTVVTEMLKKKRTFELDFNKKDKWEMTGFILACKEKRSEVVKILVAKAEDLKIDLQAKDYRDRSGFDHFPEHFNNSNSNSNLDSDSDSD